MVAEWLRAEQVQAIAARANAATPGVWTWEDDPATLYAERRATMHGLNLLGRMEPDWNGSANLDFIAAARVDVPALCAQDACWRALVTDLLAALHDAPITNVQTALWLWHDGDPCTVTVREPTARLLTALNEAQAALAAAPPAPRGATDG